LSTENLAFHWIEEAGVDRMVVASQAWGFGDGKRGTDGCWWFKKRQDDHISSCLLMLDIWKAF
jgi:hypothetical protein